MSWSKLDDKFYGHPKARAAWEIDPAAIGLWTMGLSYAGGVRESAPVPGEIPEWLQTSLFPNARERKRMAQALVDTNLWEQRDSGLLVIHDLADYNPTEDEIEQRRANDRERKRKQREREKAEAEIRRQVEAEFGTQPEEVKAA